MAPERDVLDTEADNNTISSIENEDELMAEIESQEELNDANPAVGRREEEGAAMEDTSPPADHLIEEVLDRSTGTRIDTSTLSFDRIPDMYVRVSQPITHPTAFELICSRIFLEAWQGDATSITYEDFTFEREVLPVHQPFCATPDCNCDN